MGAHNARERMIADSQFGGGASSFSPATWYVGLSTTQPNEDGSNFVEPVGMAYQRVAVTNNTVNWPASTTTTDGETIKWNGAKITWPNPTGNWGMLSYYGLFTTLTGGVPEYSNQLDASITVRLGNTPVEFDINQLVMSWE